MTDAITAARDLLTLIPLKIRKILYGVLGLVILIDGVLDVLPAEVDSQIIAVFGVFTSLLAFANASAKPLPPPPPPPQLPFGG